MTGNSPSNFFFATWIALSGINDIHTRIEHRADNACNHIIWRIVECHLGATQSQDSAWMPVRPKTRNSVIVTPVLNSTSQPVILSHSASQKGHGAGASGLSLRPARAAAELDEVLSSPALVPEENGSLRPTSGSMRETHSSKWRIASSTPQVKFDDRGTEGFARDVQRGRLGFAKHRSLAISDLRQNVLRIMRLSGDRGALRLRQLIEKMKWKTRCEPTRSARDPAVNGVEMQGQIAPIA